MSDLTKAYIVAIPNQCGYLEIETNKLPKFHKEVISNDSKLMSKKSSWQLCNDFTNCCNKVLTSKNLKFCAGFEKNILTNKVNGKISHLEKILQLDGPLKILIEENKNSAYDKLTY